MTTATDQRILVSLALPAPLAKILKAESEFLGLSTASLVRRMVKWHRGTSAGRHPDAPKVTLPVRGSKTKVNKGVLLDAEDVAYLDKIVRRVGIPRVGVLVIVMLQWFDIPAFEPSK